MGPESPARMIGGGAKVDKQRSKDERESYPDNRKKRDTPSYVEHPQSHTRVKRDGHLQLQCCCGDFCNQLSDLDEFPGKCPPLYYDQGD